MRLQSNSIDRLGWHLKQLIIVYITAHREVIHSFQTFHISHVCVTLANVLIDKMLSYRRDTALQGAL